VQGEGKDKGGHGDSDGTFDASAVQLRRWEDYERKRLRSIRRRERKEADDASSYQVPTVDDSANAGLLKNSVEDSMYYESHPGYAFMNDTMSDAGGGEGSSGTIRAVHSHQQAPQQYELQSYPSMNNSLYEPDPYGAGYADYQAQQQHHQQHQGGQYGQQPPSRQHPGGPRDLN
ncbi:hypothetical protein H4R19_003683, partial [Coemansia spiralis]